MASDDVAHLTFRDLLTRHIASHDLRSSKNGQGSRGLDRAIQACEACVQAKTKCGNERPCNRCQTRGIECKTGSRKPNRMASPMHSSPTRGSDVDREGSVPVTPVPIQRQSDQDVHARQETLLPENSIVDHSLLPTPPLNLDHLQHTSDIGAVSVMVPSQDLMSVPPSQEHPQHHVMSADVANVINWDTFNLSTDIMQFYQDIDFQFDDSLQSLNSEPMHGMSSLELPQGSDTMAQNSGSVFATGSVQQAESSNVSDVCNPRYEAFRKSAWLWTPVDQDHAYAEGHQLSVNENQLMDAPDIRQRPSSRHPVPQMADTATRDEILSLVLKFSSTSLKIRSFPSFNLLNVLIQAFFVRENACIDAWIHTGTFSPDTCRSELLAGIVAVGSTLFAVPNVWKMGLALQEIVKLAACAALDDDNRRARDLQSIQSFLLWIETGLWSGFRRKMEIGEGFANIVPTVRFHFPFLLLTTGIIRTILDVSLSFAIWILTYLDASPGWCIPRKSLHARRRTECQRWPRRIETEMACLGRTRVVQTVSCTRLWICFFFLYKSTNRSKSCSTRLDQRDQELDSIHTIASLLRDRTHLCTTCIA